MVTVNKVKVCKFICKECSLHNVAFRRAAEITKKKLYDFPHKVHKECFIYGIWKL